MEEEQKWIRDIQRRGSRQAADQLVLSEGQSEAGAVLRVLSDTAPAGAVPVTPGLEDAFLAIYREEGGA